MVNALDLTNNREEGIMGEAKGDWKCDQCGREIEAITEVKEDEKCFLICEECDQKNKANPPRFRIIERNI